MTFYQQKQSQKMKKLWFWSKKEKKVQAEEIN